MTELIIFFIIQSIIALCIAIPMGYFHEYLHIRKAKQLGCEIVKRKGNQLTINTGHDEKKNKLIANAPYKIIIPISIIILVIGIYLLQIGLMVGSGGTILIHAISYPLEGRDIPDDGHKSESD